MCSLSSKRPAPLLRPLSLALFLLSGIAVPVHAQPPSPSPTPPAIQSSPSIQPFGSVGGSSASSNLLSQPTLSPGALVLIELEASFAKSVAAGGGKAFATWFADDAVTLNNGRPPILGRANIAAQAQWDPKTYQLSWIPSGAQMGPSNDMGFTWGHYEGRSTDKNGQPVVTSGRYMTIWKKQPDGKWKVAMDASATEPPGTGECCTPPKP